METGIQPAEQTIQNATLILYHNIKNSDEERKIKKMIEEQEKKNYSNTFQKKVQQIAETLKIGIDKVTGKKKLTWQKQVKEKVISKVKKRMREEMTGRGKCRTIENDKWGRKEYLKESNSGTIKDIIKIRLHMWKLKPSYGKKSLDNRCPMCQSEVDTTEHVLECNKRDKKFNLNDERGKEWGEIQKFIERTRKTDQQITYKKSKICQKNRRKEKTVEEDKS